MKGITENQEIIYKLLLEESLDNNNEDFTYMLLDLLKQKLDINKILYFYDNAIKHQLIQFEKLNSKLRNEICGFNLEIKTELDCITSLPYFREVLFDNGEPCHIKAEESVNKWLKLYNSGKVKFSDSYLNNVNPEAKKIISKITSYNKKYTNNEEEE